MSAEGKNKFDDLFHKGLETPDDHFEFNEADWESMEANLPGEKKKPKIIPFRWMAIAASVLVVLAIGWWLLNPEKETRQQTAQVKKQPLKKDSIVINEPITTPENTGSINAQSVAEAGSATQQQAKQRVTSVATYIAPVKRADRVMRQPKDIDVVVVKDDQLIAQNTPQPNNGDKQQDSSVIAQAQVASPIAANNSNAAYAQQSAGLGANGQVATTTDKVADDSGGLEIPALPKQDAIKNVIMPKGGPVLAMSVILSPSFNGVGSLQNTKVGKTAGLLFSVGVGNKLTIGTGAVYSQVPYATSYSNYISSYSFSTTPVGVMADCRVLDIPLTVDYKFYNKGRNSFNVGAGLSSYFMLKETYNYEFAPGHAYGPTSFTVNNQNKHLFGVLDLSTTYKRQLSNKFSIGLQPYLKIPLTDIGNNRVRLQTAGVALAVGWTIINKKP